MQRICVQCGGDRPKAGKSYRSGEHYLCEDCAKLRLKEKYKSAGVTCVDCGGDDPKNSHWSRLGENFICNTCYRLRRRGAPPEEGDRRSKTARHRAAPAHAPPPSRAAESAANISPQDGDNESSSSSDSTPSIDQDQPLPTPVPLPPPVPFPIPDLYDRRVRIREAAHFERWVWGGPDAFLNAVPFIAGMIAFVEEEKKRKLEELAADPIRIDLSKWGIQKNDWWGGIIEPTHFICKWLLLQLIYHDVSSQIIIIKKKHRIILGLRTLKIFAFCRSSSSKWQPGASLPPRRVVSFSPYLQSPNSATASAVIPVPIETVHKKISRDEFLLKRFPRSGRLSVTLTFPQSSCLKSLPRPTSSLVGLLFISFFFPLVLIS